MACEHCQSNLCKPRYFHLCPACNGEGCFACSDSLIPGILEGELEDGGNLVVCTDWHDPEIDAALFDTRESLISALTASKAAMMREAEC